MTKKNVYERVQDRLGMIFNEFDNILVSFSGGKDSGIVLNLVLKYMREHGITKKIGVFHQDFEAQYTETTRYVERTMTRDLDLIRPYWTCLPMLCKSAVSMFEQYWCPWEESKRDIWVRPMPTHDGVINLENQRFDFYKEGILQEDIYRGFGPWFHRSECGDAGKTICLLGIRTQESLHRWRAVYAATENVYKNHTWTTGLAPDVFAGYPIFDWKTEDIWVANARFGFDYNRLYDLFYWAGVSIHEMRVASPFNDWATKSLKLYRVIEPDTWGAVVGRVQGANFSSIYGGTQAMAWKNIRLPKGHSWKSYVEFLLSTLPEETKATYEKKFAKSIEFWRSTGGVLSDQTIAEIRAVGIPIKDNGESNYRTSKKRIVFEEYPDDLEVTDFQSVPTFKRMAICILKNDHLCKYMGFSQTQEEARRRSEAIEKYREL